MFATHTIYSVFILELMHCTNVAIAPISHTIHIHLTLSGYD
ncbi:hypothetical protein [Dendronalium sp. ChiSLP03b]|nr:hypothetical protein [Dendronalium sp. ChiSLP03b]MDZ8208510.1 hypothetical protein [Dendronalium sp. ChiSLP03b]